MAGDWLKVEIILPDKPEVVRMAKSLKTDSDAVVGKLIRVWSWANQNSTDGFAEGMPGDFIDRLASLPGFSAAMTEVGWLHVSASGLNFPNFERHNGQSAKLRAVTNKRVAEHRRNARVTPDALQKPLPEKSREEEKNNPLTPKGGIDANFEFLTFWLRYPKKKNIDRAKKAWAKLTAEERVLAMTALPAHIASSEWHRIPPEGGDYIPYAATWLNARRWEDEMLSSYIPAKPKVPAKPAPPPPPWQEALNRIIAIRGNRPTPDDLTTSERLRIAQVLESLPREGWRYLDPEEYNYFNPIYKAHMAEKQERAMAMVPTPKDQATSSPRTIHAPEPPAQLATPFQQVFSMPLAPHALQPDELSP